MNREDPVPPHEGMKEQLTSNIARLVARRRQEDAKASASERIAEWITKVAGSMVFILLHLAFYGGALLILTDLIPVPVPLGEGLGLVGSFASVEAIFLSLFVLMNQRREELRADARADFTLHVSLLTEDELTKLAAVIHRIAEKLDVPIDEEAAEEVEKNVDPEQVLDALEDIEGDGGAPGHPARHDGDAGAPSAMKASTAS
ncbi:DUF1003 domain-containing protein [Paracoccus sp. (in: a-proteobacteria)]|uniref:DUF1003 domain-containing protein n=1 Tax=Paracoccus sp. TaxID=267 RepID=UPI0026E0BA9E|nr:DUF1003 domain-containing protein [Paracoccus sp. (in: a-proteobacteria)]MDO5370462.1 DUF1003 domain-containing protein [Paracoccus sp. (in: a-proteobacteria)]